MTAAIIIVLAAITVVSVVLNEEYRAKETRNERMDDD